MTLSQKDAVKQYIVDTETDLVKTELFGWPSALESKITELEQAHESLNRSLDHF